jgi:hypothetical protein
VPTQRASAAITEPIGNVSERRFAFGQGQGDHEERSRAVRATTSIISSQESPKKRRINDEERRIDETSMVSLSVQGVTEMVEWAVDKALREFATKQARNAPISSAQNVYNETRRSIELIQKQMTQMVSEAMVKMRAEAAERAETMLQRLLRRAPETAPTHIANRDREANEFHQIDAQKVSKKTQNALHLGQTAPETWTDKIGSKAQGTNEWTTVGGRKKPTSMPKVLKKHPADQRRVLFLRQDPAQQSDPRDIMLAINKALAQEGTSATVRLVGLRYTQRGHLSGLTVEHARAEDLLEYAARVTAAARTLDPAIVEVEKTEKWRKLRVHGVSLDRYLGEGGLDLAKQEIELMTGETLPYAPRWIRSQTLEERFHSGTVARSTLVVTFRSKNAADTIMAKGLSFGGRRHEAEKFWMKGEGGICVQCCGRDHFGKCNETAKCYVCAEQHKGSEHRCQTKDCEKKSAPCEHHAAKCANCGGKHMATSPRCPEKWHQKQRKTTEATQLQHSQTEVNTEEAMHSSTIPEQQSNVGRPERVSEPRSTPSLPKTPAVNPPVPDAEWGKQALPFEMDIESDVESSSPTPRQRSMTPITISDDSATT